MANNTDSMPNFLKITPINNLIQSFNFVVTVNEFTFGFQEVSGIEVDRQISYIDEGGVNDHQIMVGEPNHNTKELRFQRGLMLRAPSLITNATMAAAAAIPTNLARRAAMIAALMTDPQASLEHGPSLMTIKVFGRDKKLKALYTTISLGMIHWSIDSLNSNKSDVLLEEFTVVHTGIKRHPVTINNGHIAFSLFNNQYSTSSQSNNNPPPKLSELEKELQKAKSDLFEAQKKLNTAKQEKSKAEEEKMQLEQLNRLKKQTENLNQEAQNIQKE